MTPFVKVTAIVCATIIVVFAMSWAREATSAGANTVRECIRAGGQYMWDASGFKSCVALR